MSRPLTYFFFDGNVLAMDINQIRSLLKTMVLSRVSRRTGLSVYVLRQIRDGGDCKISNIRIIDRYLSSKSANP